jgi:WD40 repeat protein
MDPTNNNRIFIVCDTKIYLFNLLTLQNIDTVDTFENLRGNISITYDPIINLLAYPDKANGYVKIKNYDKNVTILTNAHENKIACLTISHDGLFLATASDKGRNIRIFRTEDGSFLEEYRVDKSNTQIYCITFDKHVQFFSCTNSTGTISIFSLTSSYKKMKENMKNE